MLVNLPRQFRGSSWLAVHPSHRCLECSSPRWVPCPQAVAETLLLLMVHICRRQQNAATLAVLKHTRLYAVILYKSYSVYASYKKLSTGVLLAYLLMPCHCRWSIGHRQLVSIQLCPTLLSWTNIGSWSVFFHSSLWIFCLASGCLRFSDWHITEFNIDNIRQNHST